MKKKKQKLIENIKRIVKSETHWKTKWKNWKTQKGLKYTKKTWQILKHTKKTEKKQKTTEKKKKMWWTEKQNEKLKNKIKRT